MSVSRRKFLLATAGAVTGFVLPSFYEKVLDYVERFGEPLITPPKDPRITLVAVNWAEGWELNWGDPRLEPNLKMTLREYANRYCDGEQGYLSLYGEEPEWVDFDTLACEEMVLTTWIRTESPNGKAFRLLEKLDLGPSLMGGESVGEVQFIDGPMPGSDYLGVEAVDLVSLSLLQQRLNELGTGIRIQTEM